MNVETQTALAKIQKVSSAVKMGCKILFVITPVYFIGMGIVIMRHGTIAIHGGEKIPASQLPLADRLQFGLGCLLTGAIILKALYHLHRLVSNYSVGDVFTAGSVAQIKHLGKTLLYMAALQILISELLACLAIFRHKTLYFSFPEDIPFGFLIGGGLLILISWVMEVGLGLREESDLTI